jgi:hypothetical protein
VGLRPAVTTYLAHQPDRELISCLSLILAKSSALRKWPTSSSVADESEVVGCVLRL